MAILQVPVLGALIRFIYWVGSGVEGFLIMLLTLLMGIFSLLVHLGRKVVNFFYPPLLFERICRLGAQLMALSLVIGRFSVKAAIAIAHSVARDFSYWAAGLAVLGMIALGIVANYYTVALRLEVGGKTIATVARETDFTNAVDGVERGLADTLGENYAMESLFTARFCVVNKNSITNHEDLYNNVYGIIAAEIGDTYGIYVDGQLVGAAETEAVANKILDDVKAPYVTGEEGETVEFVKDVEIRCGLYPDSKVLTEGELAELFSAAGDPMYYTIEEDDYLSDISEKTGLSKEALYALNPELDETRLVPGKKLVITQPEIYLGVKVSKEITYTETIAYTTTRIKDDSLYTNETKVKTQGQNGEKTITATVVYVDGVKQSSQITNEVVTKEPVTRELYVGTKERPVSSGNSSSVSANVGKGTFIRPINGGYVSCGYYGYSGHTGTDLTYRSNAYGQPVYASAGGTVIYAQSSGGGYGKLIKIQHDNGYVTYYAHLSSIGVSAGTRVSQGQYIGAIGATGRAYGAHLHFEVRINGKAVNAMKYIS